MKKYLLLLVLMTVPNLARPQEKLQPKPLQNPILAEILKLNPKVDKAFAIKLSRYIARYSKMFKTDPRLSVAIAMQETAFSNKNRVGSVITSNGRIVHGITDVGVFQIHVATIAYLGINTERLKVDVDYQTYWHTKILAEKIKICTQQRAKLKVSQGSEWACYHSFTLAKRDVYIEDVGVHLAKLNF